MPEILVVDDDDEARECLVDLLHTAETRVYGAMDGQEALDLIRRGSTRPDVILLDLSMPRMNGVTFLQHHALTLTPARYRSS